MGRTAACEWRFERVDEDERYTRATGDDPASVLSLAFLIWIDGRDVDLIEGAPELAGFLADCSDLTRRELAGLLGTFDFESPTDNDSIRFRYDDARIRLKKDVSTEIE